MKRYLVLNKPIGKTPLESIQKWKAQHPSYKEVPASYAGRLDPMASGKLLVLLGDECKRQKAYTGLDKEYEIEVLLDAGSDTGDSLGIIGYSGQETRVDPRILASVLRKEVGNHERAYPAYSSKTVDGKPLFLHALQGTLPQTLPTHEERIYSIKNLGIFRISEIALRARINEFLSLVPKTDEPSKMLGADFRIDTVHASWKEFFETSGSREFVVLKLKVACASGTYMRTLAGRVGAALGTRGLAFSIHRTKIGRHWGGLWIKSY